MAIVGLHSRTAVPACRLTSQPSCPAVLRTSRQQSHRQSSSSTARQPFVVRAEAEAAPAADLPLERSGNSFTALKDIEAIKKVLPHRSGMPTDCESVQPAACQPMPQITQITMVAATMPGSADASSSHPVTQSKLPMPSDSAVVARQVSVPPSRPRGGMRVSEVRRGLQKHHHERQLLHRPLPRARHHAGCVPGPTRALVGPCTACASGQHFPACAAATSLARCCCTLQACCRWRPWRSWAAS